MKYRVTAGVGLVALAAAAVYGLLGATTGDDGDPAASAPDQGATTPAALVAPPSPADEGPAAPIQADPAAGDQATPLTLTAPADVRPSSTVTFGARWLTPTGEPVTGEADLQRLEGNTWATLSTVPVEGGVGEVDVQVRASAVYRLAYGGSAQVEAVASDVVVVTAGTPLPSRLTATAETDEDGAVNVTAAWTTDGGVPIIGNLGLQQADGDEWPELTTVATGTEGTAVAEASAEDTARFRFSYAGGPRFAAVVSDETFAVGDDVSTIPVRQCDDDPDIDGLPRGVGCHFTPVTVGTFVVAHDYLGNAWWNSIPVGSYVELTGELPGLYEVVDRVIAQGRGSALGSASNWTCDGACDVVLQTCQGSNTGFTWLRRVADEPGGGPTEGSAT